LRPGREGPEPRPPPGDAGARLLRPAPGTQLHLDRGPGTSAATSRSPGGPAPSCGGARAWSRRRGPRPTPYQAVVPAREGDVVLFGGAAGRVAVTWRDRGSSRPTVDWRTGESDCLRIAGGRDGWAPPGDLGLLSPPGSSSCDPPRSGPTLRPWRRGGSLVRLAHGVRRGRSRLCPDAGSRRLGGRRLLVPLIGEAALGEIPRR